MDRNDTRRLGNAAKRVENPTNGPWVRWRTRSRAARAIRFMESYCRPGKGYGAGQPLKLAPFQKERVEEWLEDGVRAAAMSVARGNGKSTFLAALGTWAVFDPDSESGTPQVPVVATTLMQAFRAVYGVALEMIQGDDELFERAAIFSGIGTQRVWVPSTGGEMFPIASGPDGLQGLDPSLAICDECGFLPAESWNALLLASGKRPRSLVVGIGTPGYDQDNTLWMLRQRSRAGGLPRSVRFIEFAADDGCSVTDPLQWRKANPALAAGYLDEWAMETALAASRSESDFRIFKLGQWVSGVECWLGDDGRGIWDALEDPYELVAGAATWVGVDVGIKRDSTAVVTGQHRPDGRIHATARIWLPTRDEPVDVTDVMGYIRQLDRDYDVQAVAYDARFFDVPAKMLEDEGLSMVEIPQTVEQMTPAVGSLYETIRRGELSHDRDPAFTAQVLNAVARFNERGFTLAKAKSRGRIDATVATALMVDLALRFEKAAVPVPQVFFG